MKINENEKNALLLKLHFKFHTQLKVTAESSDLLDMAPDTVDDQYNGCHKEAMEKFIHLGLLQQELNNSKGFQRAWSAHTQCSKLIPGGIKEHTAALLAYANGDVDFIKTFNNAVGTMGVNISIYENHFHFKSLHFLLMDAMKLLNPNPKKCQTVFFLPDEKYTAQKGSKVRFGGFTTVYSSYRALTLFEDLDEEVIFNVTSCFFVNLGDICSEDADLTLLSPAEVFTVEEIHEITDGDESHTEIVLKHSELDSLHNCYIFSR